MSSGAALRVEVMVVEVERLQSSSTVKCEGPYGYVNVIRDVGEDSRVLLRAMQPLDEDA